MLSPVQIVIVELPPTPSKFHYIFNLKDLSRICAGMLLIDSKLFKLPKQFVRVWRNEFTRVICDRLVDDKVNLIGLHLRERIFIFLSGS